MAAIEAVLSIFSLYSSSSSSSAFLLSPKQLPTIKLHSFCSVPTLSLKSPVSPQPLFLNNPTRNLSFVLCSAVQEEVVVEEEEEAEQTEDSNQKRKLYVVNLPWSFSVADLKNLFGECGTVKVVDVRLIFFRFMQILNHGIWLFFEFELWVMVTM